MSGTDPSAGSVVVYRKRRNIELAMVVFALTLGLGGWLLTNLNLYGEVPGNWPVVVAIWVTLGVAAHLLVRWKLPFADPLLLPSVLLLNGLGLAMIHRIDQIPEPIRHDASTQLMWTALGMALFGLTIAFLTDHRRLQRFPYLLFLAGLTLLLLPLVPGLGREQYGARIWIRFLGYSFQPAEIAKIVLAIAFAAYLVEKREVLALAGWRVGAIGFPRMRDLGPIAIMWLASLAVLVYENDLGTSLLFFGLFVMMLYVATERVGWAILGALLAAVGGWGAFTFAPHVGARVDAWLRPFDDFDQNLQVISAQFGYAWGGLTGRGWGLGRPGLTPLAKSDFIAGALGEEIGVLGLMAVIMVFALIIARGMRMALAAHDPFGKLLAAGLSFVFALQVFAIIGGVTRLLPLTGLTTPFMSQGGSSLIANWVIIAIMLVISQSARQPARAIDDATGEMRVTDDRIAVRDDDLTQVIS